MHPAPMKKVTVLSLSAFSKIATIMREYTVLAYKISMGPSMMSYVHCPSITVVLVGL
jgi:hypothetical protein